jgi:hypothetical protein
MQNEKFSVSYEKLLLFFKSQMSPLYLLIIVFPTFDPLTATVMALYRKMSQHVKLYFAYTENKLNQV